MESGMPTSAFLAARRVADQMMIAVTRQTFAQSVNQER